MYKQGEMAYKVPILPMRYIRHFSRFMEIQGINRSAFIEGSILTESNLDELDGFLSITDTLSIIGKAQALLDDEFAPFRFGQSLDIAKHGLLGYALTQHQDVEKLMRSIAEYLRISFPLMELNLHYDAGQLSIGLEETWELGPLRDFITKNYLGSIHSLASLISRDLSFQFSFPTQLTPNHWKELLPDSPIEFNAPQNQVLIVVPKQPLRRDDDDIANYLAKTGAHQKLEKEGTLYILIKVRQHITNDPGRDSTLERIAQQLGMCTRSVRRHLKQAGFSFQEVRNEVRETYATRYLKDTSIPLGKIAARLGYSDQASFTKAYRTWTGNTPGSVRRENSPEGQR